MKKGRKNVSGLKKWNKIVSIIVKDYKKRGVKYELKEVRSLASSVYAKDFKKVAPSKLRVNKVKKSVKEEKEKGLGDKQIRDILLSKEVKDKWFREAKNEIGNKFGFWFRVGEWAFKFGQAFPEIPVMLVWKRNQSNPLVAKGSFPSYQSSPYYDFVEDIRMNLENPDASKGEEVNLFVGEPLFFKKDKKWFAVWLEVGVDIDKLKAEVKPTDIIIDQPTRDIIEEREGRVKETKKPITKKKRGRPKGTKGVKAKKGDGRTKEARRKKIELKKKDDKLELAKLRNEALKMARKDFDDGIFTKKEYKQQVKDIMAKYERGGKI